VSSFIQENDADLRSCALRLVEILVLDDVQLTYGYVEPPNESASECEHVVR
jgi:hypothetical protein